MTDDIATEFRRFIAEERRARRLPSRQGRAAEGEVLSPIFVNNEKATEFLRIAARRAVGLYRSTRHTEVVWVQGDSEIAVNLVGMDVRLGDGLMRVHLPVRCDQTGDELIEVFFAVGTAEEPSGLYASTYRRPNGHPLIVETWGAALVAFAWQCVLGMISGLAGAVGKDSRGNVFIPAELTTSADGIQIVPMSRYRFYKSSGLSPTRRLRGEP